MGRYDQRYTITETLGIGIVGDRHSLVGAIKRFELQGKQSNHVLSLKEQSARRIALISSDYLKGFMIAYLPPRLFKYITQDIFNLHRHEFHSKYTKPFYMCEECSMDTDESPSDDCQCPKMDAAVDALNKYLLKRLQYRTMDKTKKMNKFELVYKVPNDAMNCGYALKDPTSFFLYLTPAEYNDDVDFDEYAFDEHHAINGQISARKKLLFVDAMRFLGGFRVDYREPQLIFYRRSELMN